MPEVGIGAPGNLNQAHFQALKKEARERRIAEASRMLLGSPPPDALSTLADLLKILSDHKATAKHIADLQAAKAESDAAAAAAKHEAANLKAAEQSFAQRERDSTQKIEREQATHSAFMEKERSDLAAEKAATAKLKAQLEADTAAAVKARATAERRLKAMESA